ncbi:hypothetical protein DAI22_11g156700 [Oryza sativa Japonica Group]|nr:hypothetical protein DAI22_11g156700 [Oryza sativa Japonica Group]
MKHRGDGAAGLAGWRVVRGGSCHHRRRYCCWWRHGRSRGGDREAVREVGAQAHDRGGATHHIPKVAIVDEVTIIKDKRPIVVWIRTPNLGSRPPSSPVLSCSVFDFGFYLQAPVLSCSAFGFRFYMFYG